MYLPACDFCPAQVAYYRCRLLQRSPFTLGYVGARPDFCPMGEKQITELLEVYRDGHPAKPLFLSEEEAVVYINKQTDGAEYTIKPYK